MQCGVKREDIVFVNADPTGPIDKVWAHFNSYHSSAYTDFIARANVFVTLIDFVAAVVAAVVVAAAAFVCATAVLCSAQGMIKEDDPASGMSRARREIPAAAARVRK